MTEKERENTLFADKERTPNGEQRRALNNEPRRSPERKMADKELRILPS